MSIETAPGRHLICFCWMSWLILTCPQISSAAETGHAAPDLALPLVNREAGRASLYPLLNLSDYQGKVVYLDFWDTSCAPCRESLPQLSALRDRLDLTHAEVISVNLDTDPNQLLRFLQRYPVSFPVVSDPSSASAKSYGLSSVPTGFFVDREGLVRFVHRGFRPKDIQFIEERFATLIAAK